MPESRIGNSKEIDHMALSFATDIKPLFTAKDQEHMSFMFDLWDYNDVKSNAAEIYDSVSAGRMPEGDDGKPKPWPKDQVAKFKQWMNEGSKP
jgi:hypothetical protein